MSLEIGIFGGEFYTLDYFRDKQPNETCAPAGVYVFGAVQTSLNQFVAPATITVTNP